MSKSKCTDYQSILLNENFEQKRFKIMALIRFIWIMRRELLNLKKFVELLFCLFIKAFFKVILPNLASLRFVLNEENGKMLAHRIIPVVGNNLYYYYECSKNA